MSPSPLLSVIQNFLKHITFPRISNKLTLHFMLKVMNTFNKIFFSKKWLALKNVPTEKRCHELSPILSINW